METEVNEMNDLDTLALAVMIPLACYVSYKIGYWNGRRDGIQFSLDKLQDVMRVIKQIGEELYAKQNGKV
jgi:hypothetical protein